MSLWLEYDRRRKNKVQISNFFAKPSISYLVSKKHSALKDFSSLCILDQCPLHSYDNVLRG